jgi:hypothetical protein
MSLSWADKKAMLLNVPATTPYQVCATAALCLYIPACVFDIHMPFPSTDERFWDRRNDIAKW